MEGLVFSWRSTAMFAACLVIVCVAILLSLRREEFRARVFLSGFLVAVAIGFVPQIIGFADGYEKWPGLSFFPFGTELYLGPLLYLHTRSFVSIEKLGWRWALLLPGVLQTTYFTSVWLALPNYKDQWAFDAAVHVPIILPIELVLALILTIGGLIGVFKNVRAYQAFLKETQSTDAFDPSWLRLLLPGISIVAGLAIFLLLISLMYGHLGYTTEYPLLLMSAIAVAWFGVEALRRFRTQYPKLSLIVSEASAPPPKAKDWQAEGRALETAVVEGKWFLEPALSLRDLSARLATNESYASRAINEGLGMSFNAFINSLRIAYAKDLLLTTQNSVIEVAMDSGFNSKATFNRVFRQFEGVTPSFFRKNSTRLKS